MSATAEMGAEVANLPMRRRRGHLVRAVLRSPAGALAAGVLALLVLASLLAPLIAPYGFDEIQTGAPFSPVSLDHLAGTDEVGRDLFSRLLYGGCLSLGIAFAATLLAMALGIVWAGIGAMRGGLADDVAMRGADTLMAIPVMLFAMLLVGAVGRSIAGMVAVLGVLHAPFVARVVRAAVLGELHREYCTAARGFGASRTRVFVRDVLPNISPVLGVQAAVTAASVILTEASLGFVGLGVRPPQASWGTLVHDGYTHLYQSFAYVAIPGLLIFLTIWALNVLSDQVETALESRGRSDG